MIKSKDWMKASLKVRERLRAEMERKFHAIKPYPGRKNRPRGALRELAEVYGLTSSRLSNLVMYAEYTRDNRRKRK